MSGSPAPWRLRLGRSAEWLGFICALGASTSLLLNARASDFEYVPWFGPAWAFARGAAFILLLPAFGGVAIACVLALIAWRWRSLAVAGTSAVVVAFIVGTLAAREPPAGGGNEASAIGSLRAINSGQASYASSCARGGYAIDLADLVKAPPDSSLGFVGPDLKSNGVMKSGYTVTLAKDRSPGVTDVGSAASTCNGSQQQPASSYFASANPIPGVPGSRRFFATDTRGTIYFSTSGPIVNPIRPGRDVRVLR